MWAYDINFFFLRLRLQYVFDIIQHIISLAGARLLMSEYEPLVGKSTKLLFLKSEYMSGLGLGF